MTALWTRATFTPLNGKRPFLDDWPNHPMTFDAARTYHGATGVGLIHHSTCAVDMDDVAAIERTLPELAAMRHDAQYMQIVSPKQNTAKLLFQIPDGVPLSYISFEGILELRTGPTHQDAMPGSAYPDGGHYACEGSRVPTVMPQKLVDFWLRLQQALERELAEYASNNSAESVVNNKHSVAFWFNYYNSIESVLAAHPALFKMEKPNRWTNLQGSDPGGIVLYDARQPGREGQRIARIYHANSMPNVPHHKFMDAFELEAYARGMENGWDMQKYHARGIAEISKEVQIQIGDNVCTVHDANASLGVQSAPEQSYEFEDDISNHEHQLLHEDVLAPPGAWGDLARAIDKSRFVQNKASAMLATAAIVAHVLGGRVATTRRGRARLYLAAIGDNSCGKGTLISGPRSVLSFLGFKRQETTHLMNGLRGLGGSGQGLEDAVKDSPDALMCVDEFGKVLAALKKPGDPRAGVMDAWLRLWPMAGDVYVTRMLKGDGGKQVYSPNLVVAGAATEAQLLRGVSIEDIEDGFAARFLILPVSLYKRAPTDPNFTPDELTLPNHVTDTLATLAALKVNGDPVTDVKRVVSPFRVHVSPDATAQLNRIRQRAMDLPRGSYEAGIAGRMEMNVESLALGRACMDDPKGMTITAEHILWAEKIVWASIQYQAELYRDKMFSGDYDAALRGCVQWLKKQGGRKIGWGTIKNRVRNIQRLPGGMREALRRELSDGTEHVAHEKYAGRNNKLVDHFWYEEEC